MNTTLPTLALFVEGTFLPSREGATRRFVGTARNLSAMGHRTVVIHCYRGWSDLRLIGAEQFTTYAVTPDVFYGDISRLANIIVSDKATIAQFSEIETLCSIGIPLKRLVPNIQLAYECHDVHSDFLSSLGAPVSNVNRVRRMEQYALPACDLITCFTPEDRNALVKRGVPQDRLFVVPFGIEIEDIEPHRGSFDGGEIVFLGNIYHRPNQTAVKFIGKELAPSVRELKVDCTFTIVGDCPSAIQEDLCNSDIRFVGSIECLADLLPRMTMAVAPITEGSGIKVKMLDYFAAGLPTIGTSLSFRGYPPSAGLVIDDLHRMSSAIADLLGDKHRLNQMSKCARIVAERNDWTRIRQDLSKIYLEVVRQPLSVKEFLRSDRLPTPDTVTPYVLEDNITQARFHAAVYPTLAKGTVLKLGGLSDQ